MTAAWKKLFVLAKTKYNRVRISRLAHYCSALGIEPSDVTDDVTAKFFRALIDESLIGNPQRVYRDAIIHFNSVAPEIGLSSLKVPYFNDRYVLAADRFPRSLTTGIDAFVANGDADDPFDLSGRDKPLRVDSIHSYRNNLYRVASLMTLAGRDIAELTSLDTLVEIAWVKKAFQFLMGRRENFREDRAETVRVVTSAFFE